jgi:hypothetical protein
MSIGYTEQELVEHLRTVKGGEVRVDVLVAGFGGTPQAHTRFLQGLVKRGVLVFKPNHRWGGSYSLPK